MKPIEPMPVEIYIEGAAIVVLIALIAIGSLVLFGGLINA